MINLVGHITINTFATILIVSLMISTVQGSRHYYLPQQKEASDLISYYSPSPTIMSSPNQSTTLSNHPSTIPTIYPTIISTLSPSSEPTSQPSVLSSIVQSSKLSHLPSYLPSQFPSTTITSFSSVSPSPPSSSYKPTTAINNDTNNAPCDISTPHLIGKQTSNAMIISYKYKMEYKRFYEWKNITSKIEEVLSIELGRTEGFLDCELPTMEVMVETMSSIEMHTNTTQTINSNNLDIEDLFMSTVLGLSSEPSDSIIDDETCDGHNSELVSTFQCNLFRGHLSIFLRDPVKSGDDHRSLMMAKKNINNVTIEMIKLKMNGTVLKESHDAIISLEYIDDGKDILGEGEQNDDVPQTDETEPDPFSFAWVFLATGGVVVSGGLAGLLNLGLYRKFDSESEESGSNNDEDSEDSRESVETFQASNLNIPSTDTDMLLGMTEEEVESESLSTLAREESSSTWAGQESISVSESVSTLGRQSNDVNSEATLTFAF